MCVLLLGTKLWSVDIKSMQPQSPMIGAFVAAFGHGYACGFGGVSGEAADGTVDGADPLVAPDAAPAAAARDLRPNRLPRLSAAVLKYGRATGLFVAA